MAIVSNENILCEHHLQMQGTPVRRFDLFTGRMVKILLQFNLYSRKSEYAGNHRCIKDPLEQQLLSVATGDYVAGRLVGYENQA